MSPFIKAFVTKPKDKHSSSHTQIVNFVNQFGNLGGFDRLLDLMKWEWYFNSSYSPYIFNFSVYLNPRSQVRLLIVRAYISSLS